ncbi:PREDICTED: uncharacterized protein LOC105113187 isoform X2 [Populus euphratica]|uniref:Uncharacterized protein LOC105113187 isoform X2 n=1 Tax=Populus euphratica TaxID=75702 RepID=A0AAJ6TB39_POPEU|nr:PREDICTED: uncharacterized protein LOC105113187 isoform X2 [Populus euphratica]
MVLENIIATIGVVSEHTVVPIAREINYCFKYDHNFENLKREVKKLKSAQLRVRHLVDDARNNGEAILEDVIKWLSLVEEASEKVEREILEDEDRARTKCFIGLCPDLKARYQCSKKAKAETRFVASLLDERDGFSTVSHRAAPKGMEAISFRSYDAMPSRTPVLKEIMNALTTADVNMVGVYGMGGMGKTVLVKEAARQAIQEKLFNQVVFATITQTPDIKKIQGQIADQLCLKFDEESECGRAGRLRRRLKQEQKILIILDDLWKSLDLEAVGIPLKDEHEGCKMLVTSREFDVLSCGMDIRKNFPINALSEEETWELFKKMAGDHVEHPDLQSVAIEVAKKCAGLPLAIITVARALKNKNLSQWKNALRELKRPSPRNFAGVQEDVYAAIELSYSHLESKELKSTFLLCSRMGYNASTRDLLKYSMGLGLFSGFVTVEEAQDRVHSLVHKLKASGLLLDNHSDWQFSMHDAVRDVAISIAFRDCHVFVGGDEVEPKWSAKKMLKKYKEIWLSSNIELLREMEYPQLKFLHVRNEDPSLEISSNICRGMHKLKVLVLTNMTFVSLPSSLHFLKNLRTLCLHESSLGEIADIGELKKLEILSFAKSNIKHLPRQIGQLTKLRMLDLSDCFELDVIPPNIFPNLSMLEELCMGNSFHHWATEGEDNASLVELDHLPHLTNVDIHVLDSHVMSKRMLSKRLERFRIFIGDVWDWDGVYQSLRTLKLRLNTSASHLEHGVLMLLKRTQDLYLLELKGVNNVVSELDTEGFLQLQHLHLHNSSDIQYIINTSSEVPSHVFPVFESLFLYNLVSLEKLCHGVLTAESFRKLTIIEVGNCVKLKHLFPFSIARGLSQLQTMNISFCLTMEEIVAEEGDEFEDSCTEVDVMEFNQLSSLSLRCLLHLKNFCSREKTSRLCQAQLNPVATSVGMQSKEISVDEPRNPLQLFCEKILIPKLKKLELVSINVEKIWHGQLHRENTFPVQNLHRLYVDDCHSLKYLFSASMVKSLVQLKYLTVRNCKSMEEIISVEGVEEGEMISEMCFDKLEDVELSDLPRLTWFCAGSLIKCKVLKQLYICYCPEFKTFISCPNSTNMTVDVEPGELHSRESDHNAVQPLFDEKVAFPSLSEIKISHIENLEKMWHNQLAEDSFCQVRSVTISSCKRLVRVFPSILLETFRMVEMLDICHCPFLEEIFDLQETSASGSFQLQDLSLIGLDKLKHIWNKDPQGILSFPNLHVLKVSDCNVLKNLFPFSIARELVQLEKLKIEHCGNLEEIIVKGDDGEAAHCFVFPLLASLKLQELPEFRNLYPGKHTWKSPMLKRLAVSDCCNVALFGSKFLKSQETQGEVQLGIPAQQPLFFVEKVISNLEELSLGGKNTTASIIWHHQLPIECYSSLKVLKLHDFGVKSDPISFGFLQRLRNLETLSVTHSSFKKLPSIREVVGEERRALARLKHLTIQAVHDIKHIWKQDHLLAPILHNLKTLKVEDCHSLVSLAPSYVCFQNLTTLDIQSCLGLLNLFTSSTAKSLVQLVNLTIAHCKKVTVVVARQGGDEADDEIIFSKLEYLELLNLQNLTSFCFENCAFRFPSLKEMVVEECPNMRMFSPGVLSTPKLQGVHWKKYSKDRVCWHGNLDITIQHLYTEMVGFDGVKRLKVSDFPQLKERWQCQLPFNFFRNLTNLTVDEYCYSLDALPSTLLQFMNDLQELQVRNCDLLEGVFDLKGISPEEGRVCLPLLYELNLIGLSRLRHICNTDPQGILEFRNLNFLEVHDCSSLRNIFTPSMALSLVHLQKIVIRNCDKMEEIITEERTGEEEAVDKIIFPVLKVIILESLPELSSIYSGSGVLNLTLLEEICIDDCPKMKIFISSLIEGPEPYSVDKGKEHRQGQGNNYNFTALFTYKVAFPELKKLRVDWNAIMEVTQRGQFRTEFFCQIKVLELVHFPIDCVDFPSWFLQRFNILESLVVCDASFKEIVRHEETSSRPNQVFAQLRVLELSKLPELMHLLKESSQACQIFQNLEILRVSECGTLKTLIPMSVSFRCLMTLEVSKCNGLASLMSSSTAKNLVQLTSMSVVECETIEVVVANDKNEAENEIVFQKLENLAFHCLPSLTSFYMQNCALMFPSLERVFIDQCPKMELFSWGVINTPKLERVQLTEGDSTGFWKDDLNLTIHNLFVKKSKLPSSSRQPSLARETTAAHKNQMYAVSEGPASENLHVNENPDAGKASHPVIETSTNLDIKEQAMRNGLMKPGPQVTSTYQDSQATLNDKEDREQGQSPLAPIDIEAPISQQVQNDSQATDEKEFPQDQFRTASSSQQKSTVLVSPPSAAEQSLASTSASSTNEISTQKLTSHTSSRETSETITEIESLFAAMEQLVRPCPVSSSQPESSANTHAESYESDVVSLESYVYSMGLIKKILMKPLTEVARSPDGLLLLATMKNLKKSDLLNSQQLEIIQAYIDNFDSLVSNHPLYEHQIDRTSALKCSIEDKTKGISDLKNHYGDLINNASSLAAEREALKKRLDEIAEEEIHIQEDAEDIRTQLISWKAELETHMKALPEALRQQNEAENRTNNSNYYWGKIRSLFA